MLMLLAAGPAVYNFLFYLYLYVCTFWGMCLKRKVIFPPVSGELQSHLLQLVENNPQVVQLVHLHSDGVQVVFNYQSTQAGVKLIYVVVVERESWVADGHRGDYSYSARIG